MTLRDKDEAVIYMPRADEPDHDVISRHYFKPPAANAKGMGRGGRGGLGSHTLAGPLPSDHRFHPAKGVAINLEVHHLHMEAFDRDYEDAMVAYVQGGRVTPPPVPAEQKPSKARSASKSKITADTGKRISSRIEEVNLPADAQEEVSY